MKTNESIVTTPERRSPNRRVLKKSLSCAPNRSSALLAAIVFASLASFTKISAADQTEWREKMQPITPETYVCRRAAAPLKIDGSLDESAWKAAPWTKDFADIQ